MCEGGRHLSTETVQRAALSLESVDDVEGGDGLSLGVLGVGDGVSDDAFEEGLEDSAGFLVDHCLEYVSSLRVYARTRGRLCAEGKGREVGLLAEIRLTPPRRARRRMAGLVMPWMLSRRIFRWRLAPPLPRPFPPFPPVVDTRQYAWCCFVLL